MAGLWVDLPWLAGGWVDLPWVAGLWVAAGVGAVVAVGDTVPGADVGVWFVVVRGVTAVILGDPCPLEMLAEDVAAKIRADDGTGHQHEKHDAKHPHGGESDDLLNPLRILTAGDSV